MILKAANNYSKVNNFWCILSRRKKFNKKKENLLQRNDKAHCTLRCQLSQLIRFIHLTTKFENEEI